MYQKYYNVRWYDRGRPFNAILVNLLIGICMTFDSRHFVNSQEKGREKSVEFAV